MKSLNVLILEDEILIAETIKIYLEERGHQVTDIAISFDEAIKAYHLRIPDLVLLDIRLYGQKSGIDFANYLGEQKSSVPFIYLTSQYDQRILDHALKTNPYGYLTKPIQKESLWTSLETAYNLFLLKKSDDKILIIHEGKNHHQIKVNDIMFVEADHVYTKIVTVNHLTIITRKTMSQMHDLLPDDVFVYCHRSYIVNIHYVKIWNHDRMIIQGDIHVPISRSKQKLVIEKLNDWYKADQ